MDCIPASVMIIEKHPLMREALGDAISDEHDLSVGMKAANGLEAVQMLTVSLPDIILFTVRNPRTDELETLKIVRQAVPQTPIFALTSNEVQGQDQAALEAGAQVVMTKVASRSEMIHTLREMRRKNSIGHHQNTLEQEANKKISP